MNVLLVAEEAAGIRMLRILAQSGHRIVAVLASSHEKTNGVVSVANLAEKLGYQVWPAKLVKDPAFAETVRSRHVDILLNVHSRFIINREVLQAPRLGSFNLHPGPLPRYAGLNAVSWALYRGERKYGVTLHKMEAGIDAGAIAYQSFFDIRGNDSALSLSIKCVQKGVHLMVRLLEAAARHPDSIPLKPQDLGKREYFGKEIPENGRSSWSRPARQILNFVRACDYFPFDSPWGYPRVGYGDEEIGIVKAAYTGRSCRELPGTVRACSESEVEVACGDEWLRINKVRWRGRFICPTEILKSGDYLRDGSSDPKIEGGFSNGERACFLDEIRVA